jgi:hypothetical protein
VEASGEGLPPPVRRHRVRPARKVHQEVAKLEAGVHFMRIRFILKLLVNYNSTTADVNLSNYDGQKFCNL